LFGAVKTFLTLFNIQNTFISSSASNYQWPTVKNHVGTWYRCCLFLEFSLNHNLHILVCKANSVKPKKSELSNFFFAATWILRPTANHNSHQTQILSA
jgi:hypothetical protein